MWKKYKKIGQHVLNTHKLKPEDYYLKHIGQLGICSECGKKTLFINLLNGYRKYCSRKCSANSKNTEIKRKQTLNKNYGVSVPLRSIEIKNKHKKTCLKKYGFENISQNYKIKEKKKQTCLKNYGVENPSQSEIIKKRFEKTRRSTSYYNLLFSDRLKGKCVPFFKEEDYEGDEKIYSWCCTKCNRIFFDHLNDGRVPRCPTCYPSNSSLFEQDISDFCRNYFPKLMDQNRNILEGKELDIYISDINLAIECNGLYYHSNKFQKNKDYHLNKTLECQNKGIKLIHIFEDEWNENKNRIKKILLKEMKIIPRKTIFKDKMIIDWRFSNGDYLLENEYELVGTTQPKCYYIKDNRRYIKKIKNANRIWDCGKLVFERKNI